MLRSDKRGSLYYVVGKDMLLVLCVNIYIKYYVNNSQMFQVPVVMYQDEKNHELYSTYDSYNTFFLRDFNF